MQRLAKRAIITCLSLWGVLVAVYLTLGLVEHEVLPAPFNVLIMLVLSTATAGAGAAWFAGGLEARMGRIEHALDVRLNAHLLAISRRLEELEGPTVQMYRSRSHLAVVGTAAVALGPQPIDPDIIDLSRRIHRKMIEGDPD